MSGRICGEGCCHFNQTFLHVVVPRSASRLLVFALYCVIMGAFVASAIACDAHNLSGYTGTPGSCECAAGYKGNVSYRDGAPVGCTGDPFLQ